MSFLGSMTSAHRGNCATIGADPGKTCAQQKHASLTQSDSEWCSGWDWSAAVIVVKSLFGASVNTVFFPLRISHISQQGIGCARSTRVNRRKNATMPRVKYLRLDSPGSMTHLANAVTVA